MRARWAAASTSPPGRTRRGISARSSAAVRSAGCCRRPRSIRAIIASGTTLRDALAQAGFAGRPRAAVDPARYRGYLEAHIEQGAELEDTGKRIGIVTAIVGSHRFRIVFEGVQNHAGTTRMAIRKDAGVALVKLASAI